MLDNVKVVVIPHSHLKDSNEIAVGDGYARKTLAVGVPDDMVLLFARAHETTRRARVMRAELWLIATDEATPAPLRERVSSLLQELYADPRVACPVHGQYHPCGKCADEYHQEKRSENATQVATAPSVSGWHPITELPPVATKDHEDEVRCVVVWVDAENPTDLASEITCLSEIRRSVYNEKRMRGCHWRTLMDAPPAVEWADEAVKQESE